jgi:hypothetical protein
MPDDGSTTRWRTEQEQLLLEIVTDRELKPIGGDSDGKPVYSSELWAEIHRRFMSRLPALNATLQSTRAGKPGAWDHCAAAEGLENLRKTSSYRPTVNGSCLSLSSGIRPLRAQQS